MPLTIWLLLPEIINRLDERAGIRTITIKWNYRASSASPTRTLHAIIPAEHNSFLLTKRRLGRRVITTRGHFNISIDTDLLWNLLNRLWFLLRLPHVVFCIHCKDHVGIRNSPRQYQAGEVME